MSSSCVTLVDICKSYGDNVVIQNLSLAFADDATTAIVGESGSGKSTLLQLINGLVRPDAGSIYLYQKPLDYGDLPSVRKAMGYVVQGAGLFPHLSIRQNVCLVAQLDGMTQSKIDERYEYLFDLMELPHTFSQRYPYSLSGGQQQRVSLCRAMMLNPRLLLLDEAFSALDPITRHDIHDEFIRLQKEQSRSILMVTHDMHEARKLADYLVIIRAGEVVQSGEFEQVRLNPVDEYVARLFTVQAITSCSA